MKVDYSYMVSVYLNNWGMQLALQHTAHFHLNLLNKPIANPHAIRSIMRFQAVKSVQYMQIALLMQLVNAIKLYEDQFVKAVWITLCLLGAPDNLWFLDLGRFA